MRYGYMFRNKQSVHHIIINLWVSYDDEAFLLFTLVGAGLWGRGRGFRSMMDRLIYLQMLSPHGQIHVQDVCSLWVKSLRIALCNLIPSAESTGNDTTLCFRNRSDPLCLLFISFCIRAGAIQSFFSPLLYGGGNDPPRRSRFINWGFLTCVCRARMPPWLRE